MALHVKACGVYRLGRKDRDIGAHGTVASAKIISDKFTRQSRGFSFVEMSSDAEAQATITALHGSDMDGRTLTDNEAEPMERSGRSGGGGKHDHW